MTSIPEGTDGATYTTAIVTAQASASGTNTYALTAGGDAALFAIDGASGAVTIASGAAIDYESLTNKYLTAKIE